VSHPTWGRWHREVLIAAVACGAGGCHTLRTQLNALKGSESTSAALTASTPSDGGSAKPRIFDVYKRQRGILDFTSPPRHTPQASVQGGGVTLPRFDWTAHGGQLGGAFSDGASARHQRGNR